MQRSIQVTNFVSRHFCSYGTMKGALKFGGDVKLRQGEHEMAILAPTVGWWCQCGAFNACVLLPLSKQSSTSTVSPRLPLQYHSFPTIQSLSL